MQESHIGKLDVGCWGWENIIQSLLERMSWENFCVKFAGWKVLPLLASQAMKSSVESIYI